MTTEQAIKRLESHKRWLQDEFVIYCDAVDVLDMAIDALKAQLSTEDTTKGTTFEWISCKDRLPETNGEYLVTVKADSKYAFNNEPTVYTDYFQFGCQWDDCGDDVIAWMPLPDPWKGESDG